MRSGGVWVGSKAACTTQHTRRRPLEDFLRASCRLSPHLATGRPVQPSPLPYLPSLFPPLPTRCPPGPHPLSTHPPKRFPPAPRPPSQPPSLPPSRSPPALPTALPPALPLPPSRSRPPNRAPSRPPPPALALPPSRPPSLPPCLRTRTSTTSRVCCNTAWRSSPRPEHTVGGWGVELWMACVGLDGNYQPNPSQTKPH